MMTVGAGAGLLVIVFAILMLVLTSLDSMFNLIGALLGIYLLVEAIIATVVFIVEGEYKWPIIFVILNILIGIFGITHHIGFIGNQHYTFIFAIGFINIITNAIYVGIFKASSGFEFGIAGMFIPLIIFIFGFGFAIYVNFNHKEDWYKVFWYYQDFDITEELKDFKYKSIDECLMTTIPEKANNYVASRLGDVDPNSDRYDLILKNIVKEYRPGGKDCFASDSPGSVRGDDDYSRYFFYRDRETDKKEYYFKYDYKSGSITTITKKQYDEHRH